MLYIKKLLSLMLFCILFMILFSNMKAFSYSTADSFRYPLEGAKNITQNFGNYNSDWGGYHLGVDDVRNSELPVYASANGMVKWSGPATGYGNVVVIEHRLADGSNVCSVYGHMRAAGLISANIDVSKGQLIGYLSSSYSENGGYNFTHLHSIPFS